MYCEISILLFCMSNTYKKSSMLSEIISIRFSVVISPNNVNTSWLMTLTIPISLIALKLLSYLYQLLSLSSIYSYHSLFFFVILHKNDLVLPLIFLHFIHYFLCKFSLCYFSRGNSPKFLTSKKTLYLDFHLQ